MFTSNAPKNQKNEQKAATETSQILVVDYPTFQSEGNYDQFIEIKGDNHIKQSDEKAKQSSGDIDIQFLSPLSSKSISAEETIKEDIMKSPKESNANAIKNAVMGLYLNDYENQSALLEEDQFEDETSFVGNRLNLSYEESQFKAQPKQNLKSKAQKNAKKIINFLQAQVLNPGLNKSKSMIFTHNKVKQTQTKQQFEFEKNVLQRKKNLKIVQDTPKFNNIQSKMNQIQSPCKLVKLEQTPQPIRPLSDRSHYTQQPQIQFNQNKKKKANKTNSLLVISGGGMLDEQFGSLVKKPTLNLSVYK